MQTAYYNTTDLPPEQTLVKQVKCKSQEEIILKFFEANPYKDYTAWELYEGIHELKKSPITSFRRCLTNLKDRGYLKKTDIKRVGVFGELCYSFRLNFQEKLF